MQKETQNSENRPTSHSIHSIAKVTLKKKFIGHVKHKFFHSVAFCVIHHQIDRCNKKYHLMDIYKCYIFTHVISFNPHHNPATWTLLLIFTNKKIKAEESIKREN